MPTEESNLMHVSSDQDVPTHTDNVGIEAEDLLEKQRRDWEEAAIETPLPEGIAVQHLFADGVACEIVTSLGADPKKLLLWLHGGGFTTGSCKTHRLLAARLSIATSMPVLLTDYRLAPEHPFPAALEDTMTVYRWLLGNGFEPHQVAVGGDSAGGNLVMSALVALRQGGERLPAAVVLFSPWLDLTLSGESLASRMSLDPMVSHKKPDTVMNDLLSTVRLYTGGRDPADPLITPLAADLSGLPPILVHVGDHEIFLSDSIRLADIALTAGVAVELHVWPQMWHVFPAFAESLPEGEAALNRVGAYLHEKLSQ